ncbi:MAG: hypothetical protein IAE63_06415 [Alphaproteobacteria bacterium]|nr:hypothetical protein [Alphaproteobacteria bacterium]
MSSDQADQNSNIGNAVEIIERFGGIRPMASKMDVAVTTVQGWKQRNSIPAARKDDLIAAAKTHQVDLGTLLDAVSSSVSSGVEQAEKPAAREKEFEARPKSQKAVEDFKTDRHASSELKMQSPKATLAIAGVLIIAAAVIGALFAIAPKVHKLTAQEQRLVELEHQVEQMKSVKSVQTSIVPEEYKQTLSNLQNKVGELAETAQGYRAVVDTLQSDLQAGNLQQRLAKIEGHMQSMLAQAKTMGLQDMMTRIQLLQQSPDGAGQLSQVVGKLVQSVQLPEGANDVNFEQAFSNLKESDPAIAETFKDIAPEDMKAAVMLVGMSQLRNSLARDKVSFDQDLALLKSTLAKDDPELSAAIDRLAPKAQEGVLTPQGLSSELRAMTGEIVAASLAGENVSIEDKALARFGNLVKVEKDGQQISGTATQIKVAEAQKLLDQGDVEGAIVLLQGIEGSAAQATQPFIDQAQATLMAQKVQQMLGQNLVLKLKNQISGMGRGSKGGAYMATGGGLDSMMNDFKSFVPKSLPQIPNSGGQ